MGIILKPVSKISGIHGQPGEERVAQELAALLPDSYVILNSPRIHYKGETVDIDHIVIGPNGIFAIESKNMLGKITGGLMGNWTQEKRRAGKKIKIKIGNPSTQVNQYGKIIHTFLSAHYARTYQEKIGIHLYPMVVFAFDNIDLSRLEYTEPGMIGRVRILLIKELSQYILSFEDIVYTPEEISKIAEIIIPTDQRDQTGIFSSMEISEVKQKFADRYEIYEEIGRGSFAVVYRGFDFKLDREVAVKKLFTHKNDKENVKRFFREAQISAKLQHDNIVSIYDFYEEDGECYLIMEFVEGETLSEFINSKDLNIQESLEIMESICSAVQHAHELNIIHRDLKPANILINLEGKVKITDFGIARLMEEPVLTQTHNSLGTPSIMAPEMLTGKEIDARTDIFSLGVLMYFIFTGDYPFKGDHIGEVIHNIIYLSPVKPKAINENIPELVEKIILKALEKDPDDRFKAAGEMCQAVQYAINPESFSEIPDSLMSVIKSTSSISSLPNMIRSVWTNKKKRFTAMTVATLAVFLFLFLSQSYSDSKNMFNKEIDNRAYGFTNENVSILLNKPAQYNQAPVNLIGKLDKVLYVSNNAMVFRLSIQPGKNLTANNNNILVKTNEPHFLIADLQYIRVSGSISIQKDENGRTIPVINADRTVSINDPWTVISPAQNDLNLSESITRGNTILTLQKIEFANSETRIYINIKNFNNTSVKFDLENPRAKQGNKDYHELKNKYGIRSPGTIQLNANEEYNDVIFLEPINQSQKKATITLGSQNPFVYNLTWQ